jgi:hypothetical protein
VPAAVAVRPVRAADPWSLAEFYQLPEPPQDPARLPGWLAQVRRTGYCSHPVRLAGRVDQADVATGEVREEYSTEGEPGGVLLKACGNRRASVCPACAETYRRDAWQLIAAGLSECSRTVMRRWSGWMVVGGNVRVVGSSRRSWPR